MLGVLAICFALTLVNAAITEQNFQRALDALPGYAQRAVNSTGVPGIAIAVVYNGTVRYSNGFGVRSAGGNAPVTADTVFQLASVSKPIGSTIVAAIISRSNLTWNSPTNSPTTIADYSDPWISSQLDISDGFTHRSGLAPLAGDDLELFNFNRSTILSRIKYLPLGGPFRITYGYSNYGLTLAAEAAARVTGMEWADVAQQYLYGPLGMSSTSSRYSDYLTRTNRAALHVPVGGLAAGTNWTVAPSRNPDPQAPAGGATSNVVDLAKWMQLHLSLGRHQGQTLITESALNQTRQPLIIRGPNPITGQPGFYGLGWNVDYQENRVYVDHAGAFTQGVRTFVKMDVQSGLGMVVLANCFPTGWPEGIADSFFDLAQFGEVRQDYVATWNRLYQGLVSELGGSSLPFAGNPPANRTAMLPSQFYNGQYYNDYVGLVQVSGSGQNLTLTMPGSSNASVPIRHWNRDTFYLEGSKNDPDGGVYFAIGADGNATSITLDRLSTYGFGTLPRVT